jgi:hypothetical protein
LNEQQKNFKKIKQMPQLDQYSFFTQYFWLFFSFLGFYFLILKEFLPKIAQILKVRASMMGGSDNELENIVKETAQISTKAETFELQSLKESKDLLTKSFQESSTWSSVSVEAVNKETFGSIHGVYIESVGQLSLSQNVSLRQLDSLLAPTANINPALLSFRQRQLAFNKALFQSFKKVAFKEGQI